MNILGIEGVNVVGTSQDDDNIQIKAETQEGKNSCPHCFSANVVKFGMKPEIIMDTPVHGKRCGIHLQRRRMRCNACNKTFMESIIWKDKKRQMTNRLIAYIERECLKRPFTALADEIGVDESTIRQVFADYAARVEKQHQFEMPEWMGIDEIHIIKKPRCVITNVGERTVVELLENRNKTMLMKYLTKRQDRSNVKYVAMDMWRPYRDTVASLMPKAKVIVDKFHVQRMANDALEKIRKSNRSNLDLKARRALMQDRYVLLKRRGDLTAKDSLKLSGWLENFPLLDSGYNAKEAFFGIWDCTSRSQAEDAYKLWLSGLSGEIENEFEPLTKAVGNWHEEIFNFFDYPITNAYTESLNNLIRSVNRIGRGYSFDVLRTKILHTEGVQKVKRASYNRNAVFEYALPVADASYGADISTLINNIESGSI